MFSHEFFGYKQFVLKRFTYESRLEIFHFILCTKYGNEMFNLNNEYEVLFAFQTAVLL